MFNIAQSGNIVNIDSDGVEFDITVSLISGTSFQVANIEAIGYSWEVTSSGTMMMANVKLMGGFLRNSFSYYDVYVATEIPGVVGSLEYTTSKNASGIYGTVTNIHTKDGSASNTDMYPGSIVRNGDYIYICNWVEDDPDVGPWHSQVMEYQISTGNKLYITFFSDDYASSAQAVGLYNYISIIEGRKLLVFDLNCAKYDDEDPAIYRIWIVDFDANTCVEQLAIPYVSDPTNGDWWYYHQLESSCVIKDDTGDIHLLVSCKFMNDHLTYHAGWRIYHKNYTQGTAWTNTDINIDFGELPGGWTLGIYPYVISNNRYLCIPVSVPTTTAGKTTYCIYVYDVLTGVLDYVHGANDLANRTWVVLQAMEDATNHKIYFVASIDNEATWNTYEFDPATMTYNDTPIASGDLFQSGSNTELFDWASGGNISKTSDRVVQNNLARPAAIELQSNLMDNSNDSIWYLDGATLKKYNFDTSIMEESIATGITAVALGIIHLGNYFVITAQTDASGYIMDYYLVK
jgi:hypothetical protein